VPESFSKRVLRDKVELKDLLLYSIEQPERVLIVSEFSSLLQSGTSAWLFIPTAILLGALHGLEPGHSKTMMAAFIVAIRGTVMQAVLLGLAATLSHTAIVWLLAFAGLYFGDQWEAKGSEPYFQLASAVLILIIASWMLVRTWRLQHQQPHRHPHPHHKTEVEHDHPHAHGHSREHGHPHVSSPSGAGLTAPGYQDPHQQAHAADIQCRFADRQVTTAQIVLFGLTGGLIPCSAAIAVLLMCLQVKQVALGAALVLAFSIGLALTLVLSGAVAALGIRQVSKRWSGFDKFTRRAPYFSGGLIILLGLYVGWHGLVALGY